MSSLTLTLTEDTITPRIEALLVGLGDSGRHLLMEKIGEKVTDLTKEHVAKISVSKHDSAKALGAQPTGFWQNAVNLVNFQADANKATISIDHVGMGRATHDVDIVPVKKKALTIPLIARAYGQRAYNILSALGVKLFIWRSETGRAFLAEKNEDGGLNFWYALVPRVHQKQDRTLLPSDAQIANAADMGVDIFLSKITGTA